jgi:hypothetical protein
MARVTDGDVTRPDSGKVGGPNNIGKRGAAQHAVVADPVGRSVRFADFTPNQPKYWVAISASAATTPAAMASNFCKNERLPVFSQHRWMRR